MVVIKGKELMEKKEKEMDDVHVEVVMPLKRGTATIVTAIAAPTDTATTAKRN